MGHRQDFVFLISVIQELAALGNFNDWIIEIVQDRNQLTWLAFSQKDHQLISRSHAQNAWNHWSGIARVREAKQILADFAKIPEILKAVFPAMTMDVTHKPRELIRFVVAPPSYSVEFEAVFGETLFVEDFSWPSVLPEKAPTVGWQSNGEDLLERFRKSNIITVSKVYEEMQRLPSWWEKWYPLHSFIDRVYYAKWDAYRPLIWQWNEPLPVVFDDNFFVLSALAVYTGEVFHFPVPQWAAESVRSAPLYPVNWKQPSDNTEEKKKFWTLTPSPLKNRNVFILPDMLSRI